MNILFELLGFVLLAAVSIALVGMGLMIFAAVGYTQTHDPLFAIPFLLGLMFLAALDR